MGDELLVRGQHRAAAAARAAAGRREEVPQLGAVARLRRPARLPPHRRHARRLLPAGPQRAGGSVDEQGGGRAHPQLPQPAAAADLPAP